MLGVVIFLTLIAFCVTVFTVENKMRKKRIRIFRAEFMGCLSYITDVINSCTTESQIASTEVWAKRVLNEHESRYENKHDTLTERMDILRERGKFLNMINLLIERKRKQINTKE